ncbi:GerMN domain-containing protein [Mycoplasmatota bacterium]|nr:GerMN domain-containing protein [Mycoplasmatota bacterium]
MFNKFYFKFFLFCLILLLCALIIDSKRSGLKLPVYLKEEVKLENTYQDVEDYLIYVSDLNDMIFPLNIIAKEKDTFKINFYDSIITNTLDKQIYMRFSLLTNYSNYLPIGIKTLIPKSSRLMSYQLNDELLTLNVSKEFLNYNREFEEEILKILTYTFTSIPGINEIRLVCDNEEVNFTKLYKETFIKEDFILNVFLNTANINNSIQYNIYYLTNVNNSYYLVPTTIFDVRNELTQHENVKVLLTRTFNIPLITFIEANNLEKIANTTIFQENLSYYQYYLTCFDNNIIEKDYSVDIKNVNFYEIEFN